MFITVLLSVGIMHYLILPSKQVFHASNEVCVWLFGEIIVWVCMWIYMCLCFSMNHSDFHFHKNNNELMAQKNHLQSLDPCI